MERSNGIMRLLVAATVAAMLLLAMAIVAVIVTVRFRRNPRGNARTGLPSVTTPDTPNGRVDCGINPWSTRPFDGLQPQFQSQRQAAVTSR